MDIQPVLNVVNSVIILVMSYLDIKEKRINASIIYVYILAGLVVSLAIRRPENIILCAIPGLLLIAVGIVTKEEIGYGDGLISIGIGLWSGYRMAVFSIGIGIVLSSVVSLNYMIFFKHKGLSGKKTVPLIPFFLLGMVVTYWYEKRI